MRIQPKDLALHLKQGLAPFYFIWGEEPLQRNEVLDTLRAQAKNQDYNEREVIELLTEKDEERLWITLRTPSLFATKRCIECRLKEGNPTKTIPSLLSHLVKLIPRLNHSPLNHTQLNPTLLNGANGDDTIFILIYPYKLENALFKTSWFLSLEKNAITISTLPLAQDKFLAWLKERAKLLNLHFPEAAFQFIAERTEGNLVAAHQCLEKISLLNHAPSTLALEKISPSESIPSCLTQDQLKQWMIWEDRHTVFDLADALLLGAYTRTYRILESLRNEGVEPSLIIWVITREVRYLIPLAESFTLNGHVNETLMDGLGIWKQRRKLVSSYLKKTSLAFLYDMLIQLKQIDTLLKTEHVKHAWEALRELCYFFCRGQQICQPL